VISGRFGRVRTSSKKQIKYILGPEPRKYFKNPSEAEPSKILK
jgi:hypothetical protein